MRVKFTTARLKSRGFTLIELIVGIVVLSISFSLITTLILPLSEKSAEQLHQVRAAELGQSMMNEILARAFDENSDMAGGLIRCGENGVICSIKDNFGPDGTETRQTFNDVDDYHDYDSNEVDDENALGEKFSALYPGFRVKVDVCYNKLSTISTECDSNAIELAKRITVTVTTPQDFDFVFTFYKANF